MRKERGEETARDRREGGGKGEGVRDERGREEGERREAGEVDGRKERGKGFRV